MTVITRGCRYGRGTAAVGGYRACSWTKGTLIGLTLTALALGLTACVAPQKVEEPEEQKVFVWPLPPEQPRIKYLRSFRSQKDVEEEEKTSVVDAILGEKENERPKYLKKPYGVHADASGRVFVTDTGWGRLVVFDPAGKKFSFWGEEGRGVLAKPIGVTSDSQGRVYVTDIGQKRVVVYDRDGKFVSAMGQKGELEGPSGIVIDERTGRIFVVDTKKHEIAVFDTEGQRVSTIGELGKEPGQFHYPTNLALGRDGNLYVVDTLNFRVQILNQDGGFVGTFGENGDSIGKFARPKGIAVDSEGHVYVVDAAFANFQIFNPDGQLLLFVGSWGGKPGDFQLPAGAYIDAQDRIYVADQYNYRVQVFQFLKEGSAQETEVESAPEGAAEQEQG